MQKHLKDVLVIVSAFCTFTEDFRWSDPTMSWEASISPTDRPAFAGSLPSSDQWSVVKAAAVASQDMKLH